LAAIGLSLTRATSAGPAKPGAWRAQGPLHALFRFVGGNWRGRSRCRGQQFLGIVRLFLDGWLRRCPGGLHRRDISGLRRCAIDVIVVGVSATVGRGDIAVGGGLRVLALSIGLRASALLMPALLVAPLLVAPLLAALMTALLMTTLPVPTLARIVTWRAMALAALVAGVLALHAVALQVRIGHSLRIGTAGGIERGRQALAHILDIDIGDRELASASPRALAVIHRAQHAIVMVSMLQEVLSSNPVARGARVARELQVFFEDLVGIAANPQLLPALVSLILVMATAAAHPVGLARAPAARASVIVILFHVSVTSSSIVIEMAGQAACRRPCAFCNILKRLAAAPLGAGRSQCAEALFLGLASLCDGRLSPGRGPWSAPTAGADPSRFGAAFQ